MDANTPYMRLMARSQRARSRRQELVDFAYMLGSLAQLTGVIQSKPYLKEDLLAMQTLTSLVLWAGDQSTAFFAMARDCDREIEAIKTEMAAEALKR